LGRIVEDGCFGIGGARRGEFVETASNRVGGVDLSCVTDEKQAGSNGADGGFGIGAAEEERLLAQSGGTGFVEIAGGVCLSEAAGWNGRGVVGSIREKNPDCGWNVGDVGVAGGVDAQIREKNAWRCIDSSPPGSLSTEP